MKSTYPALAMIVWLGGALALCAGETNISPSLARASCEKMDSHAQFRAPTNQVNIERLLVFDQEWQAAIHRYNLSLAPTEPGEPTVPLPFMDRVDYTSEDYFASVSFSIDVMFFTFAPVSHSWDFGWYLVCNSPISLVGPNRSWTDVGLGFRYTFAVK